MNTYDIGSVYFLYGDYEKAKNYTLEQDMNIDLLHWNCLGYSFFKSDQKLFYTYINKDIQDLGSLITDVDEDDFENEKEKKELLEHWQDEIDKKKNAKEIFRKKPEIDIDRSLVAEYYGCSIYGCNFCGNLEEDDTDTL